MVSRASNSTTHVTDVKPPPLTEALPFMRVSDKEVSSGQLVTQDLKRNNFFNLQRRSLSYKILPKPMKSTDFDSPSQSKDLGGSLYQTQVVSKLLGGRSNNKISSNTLL